MLRFVLIYICTTNIINTATVTYITITQNMNNNTVRIAITTINNVAVNIITQIVFIFIQLCYSC